MPSQADDAGLRPDLRDRVLERLGFSAAPAPDLAGLRALYRAWCLAVPFDNVRKMVALRAGDGHPLPGRHAAEFFEGWLAHGAGGTCWPTSNALFALARAVGFDTRRVAGSMRDLGAVNHGSVKVALDGQDWLVDSSLLTNDPLPLGPGVFVHGDPVFPAEVEASDATHVIWAHTPPNPEYLPCRLLVDPPTTPSTSTATSARASAAPSTSASTPAATVRASCGCSWAARASPGRRAVSKPRSSRARPSSKRCTRTSASARRSSTRGSAAAGSTRPSSRPPAPSPRPSRSAPPRSAEAHFPMEKHRRPDYVLG